MAGGNRILPFNPIPGFIRRWHLSVMGNQLARYGFQFHDVLAESPVFDRAFSRLPAEMQEATIRRQRRALDMSLKKKEMPLDKREDPFRDFSVVDAVYAETQREADEERVLTNQATWAFRVPVPGLSQPEPWYGYDTRDAWFWNGRIEAAERKPEISSPSDLRKLDA